MYGGTHEKHAGASGPTSRVYPRVYGGTVRLVPRVKACFARWSIPACTGEPWRQWWMPVRLQRSIPACTGEPVSFCAGSAYRISRSIPACTGEPWRQCVDVPGETERVYPRVYGGTATSAGCAWRDTGLSPRVRGNRRTPRWRRAWGRSIPACTGEPPWPSGGAARPWVYPRVYGGTFALHMMRPEAPGLSPRVRGNLGQEPARVGMAGLSPRVRGNPQFRHPGPDVRRRSIPACTGEPVALPDGHTAPKVYPRVYGGTDGGTLLPDRPQRSIPACTGEPLPEPLLGSHPSVYPRVYGGTRHRGGCAGSQGCRVYPRVYGGTRAET